MLKNVTVKELTVQETLMKIKETIEGIKDIKPLSLSNAEALARKSKIAIPFPHPGPPKDTNLTFSYQKPNIVSIVGSFLLNTVAQSPHGINIDVAVEMPNVIDTNNIRLY